MSRTHCIARATGGWNLADVFIFVDGKAGRGQGQGAGGGGVEGAGGGLFGWTDVAVEGCWRDILRMDEWRPGVRAGGGRGNGGGAVRCGG